jgi:Ca-activated chloride channel family protein
VKFAHPWWLFGTGLALGIAALLVIGGFLLVRSVRRFGDEAQVDALITGHAGGRRALKGALLVLAVALGFVALAQPQYGRGTRLIPATNLDVVIVLDYSKSMYARDVKPSRTARAKSEVARLIADLPGARFGAVAFAGEPMSFPLTSDGSAIAQFFRQLTPNDMPAGGTVIGRALEAGRELLLRDPLSKKHEKVMVLVTDGENQQGDPIAVARAAARDGISVHVVQIGGRTPEPLPDVNEAGEVIGWRTLDNGQPLTTALSAEDEAQLASIARESGGHVVRSEQGETGIPEIASRLRTRMTEELSERVETVYADVFYYPLALAILLLFIETFVPETRKRREPARVPPPPERRRPRRKKKRALGAATATALGLVIPIALSGLGCEAVDSLFVRNSPEVDEAIALLDGGDASAAVDLLEQYLSTGACDQGRIGTPEAVAERPNAGFDLGLGLFRIGETFGKRFGEEEGFGDGGMTPAEEQALALRSEQVDCALKIVSLVGRDPTQPVELRARAYYLAGNLEFLRRNYKASVVEYDRALKLIPGLPVDAGDAVGRDAAWNRAIALRRIEDQENQNDAGQDAQPDRDDASPEGGDGGQDGERDSGGDSGDNQQNQPESGAPDAGPPDSGQPDEQGQDGGQNADQPPPEPEQGASQDERMLDMLERAPTLQQEAAKNRALQRDLPPGMVDK